MFDEKIFSTTNFQNPLSATGGAMVMGGRVGSHRRLTVAMGRDT